MISTNVLYHFRLCSHFPPMKSETGYCQNSGSMCEIKVYPAGNSVPETCMFQRISCMDACIMHDTCMMHAHVYHSIHGTCMVLLSMHDTCMNLPPPCMKHAWFSLPCMMHA